MAQKLITEAGEIVIPGAYPQTKVDTTDTSIATTGVIVLIGEADAGPDFTAEADLSQNWFGPNQAALVRAKYRSGPIVDGFLAAASPSIDPEIAGAPARIYILKTNKGSKASAMLGDYGLIQDKGFGAVGNMTSVAVESAGDEVGPTTGAFAFVPVADGSDLKFGVRLNGEAVAAIEGTAGEYTAADLVDTINESAYLLATGGQAIDALTGNIGKPISLRALDRGRARIVLGGGATWNRTPVVGSTLTIKDGSSLAGGGANVGSYVVVSATSSTVDVVAATVTAPVSVSGAVVAADTFYVWEPVTIREVTGKSKTIGTGLSAALTVAGETIHITLDGDGVWEQAPVVGDLLQIPTGSALEGTHNAGWYKVVAATSATVSATRISNLTGELEEVATTAITGSDLRIIRPSIDGVGKTMEIYDNGGSVSLADHCFTAVGEKVAFVSTRVKPVVLTSTSEAKVRIVAVNGGIRDEVVAGGQVALAIGVKGSGTLVIADGSLALTANSTTYEVTLKDYPTVGLLAAYLNTLPGVTAKPATGNMAGVLSEDLDEGTYLVGGQFEGSIGIRIKTDAATLYKKLAEQARLVELTTKGTGLPEPTRAVFLTGGARGGSKQADIVAAIDACSKLQVNFIVPLFSRNAQEDIFDGLTDPDSDYEIEGINTYVRSHVVSMSSMKRRKPRQAFCSYKGSFADAKLAANNLNSHRVALAWQDARNVGADGFVKQFSSWSTACTAAGMQAAGFNKAIFAKGLALNGAIQAAGDFDPNDEAQVEDALLNGLLTVVPRLEGGFQFVSDQTTYSQDTNFVYNSIQAVYVADIITMTIAQRMERAFVGRSVAEIPAALALAELQNIMRDLLDLKLIAPSDGAPAGYKDASVRVEGPIMRVSVRVFLAGAYYFIPIETFISPVTQTAA